MRHFNEIREIHETAMRQEDASKLIAENERKIMEINLLYEIGADEIRAIRDLANAHRVTGDMISEKLRFEERTAEQLRNLKNATFAMKTLHGINANGIDVVMHSIHKEFLMRKNRIGQKT